MNKKKIFRNCFVISPLNVNLKPLREVLEARSIKVKDAFHIPTSKLSISMAIEKEIRDSDFVCAIISSNSSPHIFFEIGLAKGAEKPIFIIFENENEIPLDLKNIAYVKTSSKDKEAIAFSLDQFLDKYKKIPKSAYYRKNERKTKKPLDSFFMQNLDLISQHREIEMFLVDLFENLEDVRIVTKETYSDNQIDMVLWVDKLESNLKNPVLIEVKVGNLSKNKLKNAEDQLIKYLKNANASTGLLIYLDRENRHFKPSESKIPLIIWLEFHDLVQWLYELSLADIIVKERNKMAHYLNEV